MSSPSARGYALSVRDVAWIIRDEVHHAGVEALVAYDVGEEIEASGSNQIATLRASATIVDPGDERRRRRAPGYRPTFPVQLFSESWITISTRV